MRNIRAPELAFGIWTKWDDRRDIPNSKHPGIYLLRIGRRKNGEAQVQDAHYIGMTNNRKGLRGRWSQFDRAVRGLRGHSGGNLAYAQFGHRDKWGKELYVAAMPVICNPLDPTPKDYIGMGIVAYLEYEAFARFRKLRPLLKKPRFNRK